MLGIYAVLFQRSKVDITEHCVTVWPHSQAFTTVQSLLAYMQRKVWGILSRDWHHVYLGGQMGGSLAKSAHFVQVFCFNTKLQKHSGLQHLDRQYEKASRSVGSFSPSVYLQFFVWWDLPTFLLHFCILQATKNYGRPENEASACTRHTV